MAQKHAKDALDPRSKLCIFLAACFSAFSGMSLIQEIALLALCVTATMLCRCYKRACGICLLFLAMLLSDIYIVPRLNGIPQYFFMTVCRVLRFVLPLFAAFYLVTRTTKIGAYISALTKLHMPSEVVIPLAVMFRFVPTVEEEWRMVNQALRLRGMAWSLRNVMTGPMRMLEYMLVPFLMQCSDIVDEMSAAVMARGFDRDTRRSSYVRVEMTAPDWLLVAASAAILVWNLLV